jgi:23S rRNA (cytosine1962-C5)-methyltransferase
MQQIKILQDRTKPFLQRHSWVFSGAVASFSNKESVGIAEVTDEKGTVLGYGFTDPESQIVCRIFHFGEKPEKGFGLPYWTKKFKYARKLREGLVINTGTDTYRFLHAEGDEFPGIIVDVYGGTTAVVHTLIDATGQWIDTWKKILLEMGYLHIYHKHSHDKAAKWLTETSSSEIEVLEHGMKFIVDVEKGQKTGFFIDQRENRKLIGGLSRNRKVLNAFGFTGGFSVYALAGGAKQVVDVDISKEACEMASRNVALNGKAVSNHSVVVADCFDYLKDMDADFDLIILDPPAFAKNKASVDKATRGYKEINMSAIRKIASGGIIATFSCSQHIDVLLFRKIVFGAAVDAGRAVRVIGQFHQPADHPTSIFHPEGAYLKGLLLYVD